MKKLIRSLNTQIKIIGDPADGVCDYIASDASLDCYNEVILPAGWRFNLFAKNSPFVDCHNYGSIDCLLGNVTAYAVQGGQLINRVKWAIDVPENELAQLGWKMTVGGYLRAVSVGFYPEKALVPYDTANKAAYLEACQNLNLAPGVQPSCIYTQQEQIELSACVLGANPNALAKAHKDGVVNDQDLSRIGFATDDDLTFLHACAEASETGTIREVLRREMASELRSIFQKRKSVKNAPAAAKPADATSARRLARAFLLEELKSL